MVIDGDARNAGIDRSCDEQRRKGSPAAGCDGSRVRIAKRPRLLTETNTHYEYQVPGIYVPGTSVAVIGLTMVAVGEAIANSVALLAKSQHLATFEARPCINSSSILPTAMESLRKKDDTLLITESLI